MTGTTARFVGRSADEVAFHQLEHRRVRMLLTPDDGIGDLSVVLALFEPGRAMAHVHWPGGEALYVVRGRGRLRVEGLPFPLEDGVGAFTPPCVLHHVENDAADEMIIIGAFVPSSIPGSYPDQPPILEPTGRLNSVDRMWRRADLASRVDEGEVLVSGVVDDRELSPHATLRLVRLGPRARYELTAQRGPRAVLCLDGTVSLGPKEALVAWSIAGIARGETLVVAAEGYATVLDVESHLNPARVHSAPCD